MDWVTHILTSEFFWGVLVGLVLTIIGSYFLVQFQNSAQKRERERLFRNFCADTINNLRQIVEDMNDVQARGNVIHSDFLILMDTEIGVFGRNREHLITLPQPLKDKVRAFVNDCAVKRAEIGGNLDQFGNRYQAADAAQASGNGPLAQRVRTEGDAFLGRARAALGQLVVRAKDAHALLSELAAKKSR